MAVPENRLGDYFFLSLAGQVELPQESVALEERPGVPGITAWRAGKRGKPFQLTSRVDTTTLEAAYDGLAAYGAMVGADPFELIKNGENISQRYQVRFLVLSVRAASQPRRNASLTGGLNSPSAGWLEVVWDLVAITVT